MRRRRRPGQPGRARGAAGAHGQHTARRARPGAQPAARAANLAAALRKRAADMRRGGAGRGGPDRGPWRRGGGCARARAGACPGWDLGRDPAVPPPPPGGRSCCGEPRGVARTERRRCCGVRRAGAHGELPGGAGGGWGQEGRAGVQAAARARRAAAARVGARAAARRRQAPAHEPEQARPSRKACCLPGRATAAMHRPVMASKRLESASSCQKKIETPCSPPRPGCGRRPVSGCAMRNTNNKNSTMQLFSTRSTASCLCREQRHVSGPLRAAARRTHYRARRRLSACAAWRRACSRWSAACRPTTPRRGHADTG